MESIEIFKKTKDDFYGNYNGDEIRVYFAFVEYYKHFVICCSGNDDFGLYKYFDADCESEAKQMFELIKSREFVNKDELHSLGFFENN